MHEEISRGTPTEIYMLKDQEPETPAIQKVITIISFRESMELSLIRFYNKAIIIQRAHNKNKV